MLFFIVSGFSLMYTYTNRLKSRKPRADFYTHRIFRIYPLFFVVFIYYLFYNKIVLNHSHSKLEIISNLSLTYNLIPGLQTSVVWAGWTVGVEVFFYLLFPLIFVKCSTILKSLQFLVFSIVISILYKNLVPYLLSSQETTLLFQQWFFMRYLPVFAMGIVCFRVWERRNVLTSRGNPQAIGGFAIILSILILLTQPAGITSMLGDSLYTQGLAFLLLTLGLSISPIKIIVNKYFNWLGSLSYSIYLLHPIIIWTSQDLISTIYTLLPSSLAFISSTLLILTMVVTVSFISEKIIESPFIALGKKISRRFFV